MIKFSWNMLVADLKTVLRGAWWLAFVFIAVVVIVPYTEGTYLASMSYLILMSITLFVPHFSRIHHIVPLGEKQVKQLFLLRILLVSAYILLLNGAVIWVCEWKRWAWNKAGLTVSLTYIAVLMLVSEKALQGFGIGENFKPRHIFSIIWGLISLFVGFGVLIEVIPYAWNLGISGVMVLGAVVNMLYYLKDLKFEDFTYVPIGIWNDGKTEKK